MKFCRAKLAPRDWLSPPPVRKFPEPFQEMCYVDVDLLLIRVILLVSPGVQFHSFLLLLFGSPCEKVDRSWRVSAALGFLPSRWFST